MAAMPARSPPPAQQMRPPPPPNPFVVLEEDLLNTELGKQGQAAWGAIQVAAAPLLRWSADAIRPAMDASNAALRPLVELVEVVLPGPLKPKEPVSPITSMAVMISLLVALGFLMHKFMVRWEQRAFAHKQNRFAPRGTVANAEAAGVQPLLADSRKSGKSPRGGSKAQLFGGNGRLDKVVPDIRIGLPSGTPSAGSQLPPLTSRGGPGSGRGSDSSGGAGGGGRFMRGPAVETVDSARSQTPNGHKQIPARTPRGATVRPDWLDAVGRGGPPEYVPISSETPRLSRPSTMPTPRQALTSSARAQTLRAEAAADGSAEPENSWFGGFSGCASARGAETSAFALLSYRSHRSGRSTPRIDALMSSTPRLVSWQGVNPHHKLQIAFEPFPAGWDDTETEPPKHRMLSTYLPPIPPEITPVDEVFFILHATDQEIPSPLPDWAHEWVRNAILFGRMLTNNQLRTRDIYGLPEQESVFEVSQFVIHVPMELNPHLAEDLNVVQDLFRLGTCQMPDKKQITRLPVKWAEDVKQPTAEDDSASAADSWASR